VVVRTRGGANVSLRMVTDAWGGRGVPPSPAQYGSVMTASGQPITATAAAGIPAVLDAVWLIAESVASIPLRVYTGRDAKKATDEASWQWVRLHDRPNDEQSAFDFWFDIAVCIETEGNAFALKDKAGSVVRNLYLMDPNKVKVRRGKDNEKLFIIRNGGDQIELTAADVLHFRGPTLKGGDTGMTPLALAREMLGSTRAGYLHEGHFLRNHNAPPVVIQHPEAVDRTKAQQLLDVWMMTHSGAGVGLPAILGNGAELKPFGINMRDAQFIESRKLSVEDIARAFRIPRSMLNAEDQGDVEQETTRFLSHGLNPRLNRIRSTLLADPDFTFGFGVRYPEHYADEFIRVDAATRASVRHQDVQSGVLLPDEARADMGRPPLPDGLGRIPQITPVGGAPNPLVAAATDSNGNGNGASAA
jgi:HK97 family phage portal protein